jgi:DNA mismatch repair protein MutH
MRENMNRFNVTQHLQELIGHDLRKLADQHNITVFKDGKLNKGWAGLTLERVLGIANNCIQAPDGELWELKLVPLTRIGGSWKVKESMSITMFKAEDVLEKTFQESHLFHKMQRMIICGRERKDRYESSSELVYASNINVGSTKYWSQIQADYELIQSSIKNQGFEALTGHLGKFIQPRTKGRGHGSKTMAFYARPRFVEILFGIREEELPSPFEQQTLDL